MNKTELIDAIAKKNNMSYHDVDRVIGAEIDIIKAELAQGGKVKLLGFGTFEVKTRAEHKCINPRTNEPLAVPAHKSPAFKAGKWLREAIKNGS